MLRRHRRPVFAIAALATPFLLSATASAETIDAAAVRGARATDVLTISRPDGTAVAVRVRSATTSGPDAHVVIADRLDGLGHVVLAQRADAVAGYLTGAGGTFRLQARGGGALAVTPAADGFDCGVPDPPKRPAAGDVAAAGGCGPQGVFQDLLVLYTDEVEAAFGGEAATLAEIDAVMAISNLALADSSAAPRFRLVLAWKIDADDDTSLGELTDPDDGVADIAHVLRDLVAADHVKMLYASGGGVANGVWVLDPAQEANAFCRSGIDSFPWVFPHELGHNMGCCHAFGDGGGCPSEGGLLFEFSNGWRWFGNSGTEWRTIMAYSPGERLGHFSNPNVDFDGQPTGTADADNVLTQNLSLDLVSNFRCAADAQCGDLSAPNALDDCNANGIPDGCDIGSGASLDGNGNGIPDECDPPCPADINGSGEIEFGDLLTLLAAWGPCPGCAADIDGDNVVDFEDLLALLAAWGPCR